MSSAENGGPGDEVRTELARSIRRLWRTIFVGIEHPPVGGVPLQSGQFWVLRALAKGPRRMSELAEITRTSSANITGIVDRLAERGIVERTRPISDRRVVEVALTKLGRTMMAEGMRQFQERVEQVLAPLTAAEQAQLARLLKKVLE